MNFEPLKTDTLEFALSDLYRLINRKKNLHPELFSKLDLARMNNAQEVMKKHAKPFDPKHILRKSENGL